MTDKTQKSTNAEPPSDDQEGQRPRQQEKKSFLSKLFAFKRSRPNSSLRDDLTDALNENSENNAVFTPEERTLLNNILSFREARVEDVAIPRSDIEALEIMMPLGEALEHFEKSGHSRMPVYAETLDDPRGMIHIRDVLNYITREARKAGKAGKFDLDGIDLDKPVGELDLMRTVLFVPSSMLASQLLSRMQATRTQIALVVDEHGGIDGLVSMEDIVELVVGDIEDEHDDEDVMILKEPDDCWLIDGRAELDDVCDAIGPDFKTGDHGDEVDTIGGFIVSVLDRIPARGEVIETLPGFRCQILEADKRRIRRLRIKRMTESKSS